VDNHADFANSAHGVLSRKVIHGVLWRLGLKSVDEYVTRYWGITEESCDFLSDLYRIPRDRVELLPLGAGVDVQDDGARDEVRARVRQRLGVAPSEFLMITGGKIDSRKRVHEIMTAVHEMGRQELKLLVFGSVLPDIRETFDTLLEEPGVTYAGWADASTITEYLIAADLAVFPGGQSVLWMHAVVCGVPCVFRRWPKGSPVDVGGNCVFLETAEYGELLRTLEGILENRAMFERMRDAALRPERWKYSYANIAARAIDEQ
jgi:glycosyltransferase involved in cell wall biosynthesis